MTESRKATSILVAMPGLVDSHFFKSVVLLVDHTAEGAFGFIINKPGNLSLATVIESEIQEIPEDLGVWYGGPVEPNLGIILRKPLWSSNLDYDLLSSKDALRDMINDHRQQLMRAAAKKPRTYDYRFIIGSASWGEGQLDSEMKSGSWMQLDFDQKLVFETPSDQIWRNAFASVGVIADNVIPLYNRLNH